MAHGIIYMQGSSLVGIMLGASILTCVLLLVFSESGFAIIMKPLLQMVGIVIFSFCQITSAQTSPANRESSFDLVAIAVLGRKEMLQKYGDAKHRLKYGAWKQNDPIKLDAHLSQIVNAQSLAQSPPARNAGVS